MKKRWSWRWKIEEKEKHEINKEKEVENEEVDAYDESEVEYDNLLHRLFDGWIVCFYFDVM